MTGAGAAARRVSLLLRARVLVDQFGCCLGAVKQPHGKRSHGEHERRHGEDQALAMRIQASREGAGKSQ